MCLPDDECHSCWPTLRSPCGYRGSRHGEFPARGTVFPGNLHKHENRERRQNSRTSGDNCGESAQPEHCTFRRHSKPKGTTKGKSSVRAEYQICPFVVCYGCDGRILKTRW